MLLTIESLEGTPWHPAWALTGSGHACIPCPSGILNLFLCGNQRRTLAIVLEPKDPLLLTDAAMPLHVNSSNRLKTLETAHSCGIAMAEGLLSCLPQLIEHPVQGQWKLRAYRVAMGQCPPYTFPEGLGTLVNDDAKDTLSWDWVREATLPLDQLISEAVAVLALLDEVSFVDPKHHALAQHLEQHSAWLNTLFPAGQVAEKQGLFIHGNPLSPFAAVMDGPEPVQAMLARWDDFLQSLEQAGLLALEHELLTRALATHAPAHVADLFAGPPPLLIDLIPRPEVASVCYHHVGRPWLERMVAAIQSQGFQEETLHKVHVSVLPVHYHLEAPPQFDLVFCRTGLLLLPDTFQRQTLDELLGHWRPKAATILMPGSDTDNFFPGKIQAIGWPEFQSWTSDLAQTHGFDLEIERHEVQPGAASFLMRAEFTQNTAQP